MFLFLFIVSASLAATAYYLFFTDKATSDAPHREKPSAKLKLTRNGFTSELDELNYQQNLKKINQEKKEFAEKELKKSAAQKKIDEEKAEKGRTALIELGKLTISNKDKKEELELVIENPKPANDALDFFLELEKPQQNEADEAVTEISSTIAESIIGDVLSSAVGLPVPFFELASTLNDAYSEDPKPTNSMPAKRKRM